MIFVWMFYFCFITPAFAANRMPRLVDEAALLSEEEQKDLQSTLDEISERQKADIVVVTVNSMDGKTAMEYADDFYDQNGYGYGDDHDGALLLVCMETRDWHITTTGFGITAITDAGIESISENFLGDLSNANYEAAFTTFATQCDAFFTQAKTAEPYDTGFLPEDSYETGYDTRSVSKDPFGAGQLLLSFGAAFLIALIAVSVMKSRLKSVRGQYAADDYIKKGSMQLTKQTDLYLYKQVHRVVRPKETTSSGGSTTHSSSSGSSHGGGGGKF